MGFRRFLAGLILAASLPAWAAEPANPKIIERYKQMLAANPAEGTALERLWKIYLDQNATQGLIGEYRASGTFAGEMVLGHLLRRAAQPEEAARAYQRAAKLDPASALPWLALGRLKTEAGAPREAAAAFEKGAAALAENDPGKSDALLELGTAWLAAGEPGRAGQAWEKAAALDPSNLALRRKLANAFLQNQLPEQALAQLEYLEKHAPPQDRAQALQDAARLHQAAGRQDAAIGALERAMATVAPGSWRRAELQAQFIRMHQRFHRMTELEERWLGQVRENPRDMGAYLQLLDLYERTGELERQREGLEKLTALAPKAPEYRLKLARLLVRLDAPSQAAPLYDQLLREQPASVDLVLERAELELQGDATAAAKARLSALAASRKGDEVLRSRLLAFYETHRLDDLLEGALKDGAASGVEEPVEALANFYFSRRRSAEALAALARLVPAKATPGERAAALFHQAQLLKAQGETAPAAAALREAAGLGAPGREMLLLLGELELALKREAEARHAFEGALALGRNEQEKLEADQKLFESFRDDTASTPEAEGSEPEGLQTYLLEITRQAATRPSVEGWLRAARWHFWMHDAWPAVQAVQKALALEPGSLAAHEWMVRIAAEQPQSGVARQHLEELARLDPARAADYRRRSAQLELQAGRIEEALPIFSDLARQNPGSAEALSDLALAYQRGGDWTKAAAAWEQVYNLSPASRKKEAAAALLRVYERLEQPRPAAELLVRQMEAAREEKEQFAVFQELLAHCSRHGLLDWLNGLMAARLTRFPDDYFTEMALGRILKMSGSKAAAFEMLANASFAAANQAEALPELVREAEELRKFDTAVRLQDQLLRIVPQAGPEGWIKLAQLQEASFDLEGATRTWAKVAAKYPRDLGALEPAVEFQLNWGSPEQAAALLRRVRELDPANLRALAQLARLDIEAGRTDEAAQCLEQILARSAPEPEGETLRIPGKESVEGDRLRARYVATMRSRPSPAPSAVLRSLQSFWTEPEPPGGGQAVRLGAIRDLAQLVAGRNDPAQLRAWVARWQAPSQAPGETLAALYHAGAGEALLDYLEAARLRAPEDAQLTQAFIWLALQTGALDRLAAWLHDPKRSPAERDFLLVALAQHFQAHPGAPVTDPVQKLFPPGYRQRLWQAAALLAASGYYPEAIGLGRRVFDEMSTQRAGYGLEIAHWHLCLGQTQAAREVLRASLGSGGESFDSPVYSALREYYLLLPEAERAGFSTAYLAGIDEREQPLHRALAGALLAGLSGDEAAAAAAVKTLLGIRALAPVGLEEEGNSASRYWDFVLGTGVRLAAWKLDRMAVAYWEGATGDEALIQLTGAGRDAEIAVRVTELRVQLAALRLLRCPAFDAAQVLEDLERRTGFETLPQAGQALEAMGAHSQAVWVHRRLWEREPTNTNLLRLLLGACRMAEDFDTLEEVLTRCVRDHLFQNSEATHRDLTLQLADALETRGASAQAGALLGEALENAPADGRLFQRRSQLLERDHRRAEAEAACRSWLELEPSNPAARVALAGLLERYGRAAEAVALLEKGTGTECDSKLAPLLAQAGRMDDAVAVLGRITAPNHAAVALRMAGELAARGERMEARRVLVLAMARSADPHANLPLQSKSIELLEPVRDRLAIPHEIRRLRAIAAGQPEALSGCFDLLLREAPRLQCQGELEADLREEWDQGRGAPAAGVALLEMLSKDKKPAEADAVWKALQGRGDLGETLLLKCADIFDGASRPELAVQARGRLARVAPLNYQHTLDWAQALIDLDRPADARAALETVAGRAALDEDIAAPVAQLLERLGDRQKAAELFARACAADPAGRSFQTHLDYARLLLREGRSATARRELQAAFQNASCMDFGALIEFAARGAGIAPFERLASGLALRPRQLLGARRAFLAHLEASALTEDAMALLEAHPEIWEAGTAARVRRMAAASLRFEKAAALLEKAATAGAPGEKQEAAAEFAGLCGDWAEAERQAGREAEAEKILQRAQRL